MVLTLLTELCVVWNSVPLSLLEMFCLIIQFCVSCYSPVVGIYTLFDLFGKLDNFIFHLIFFPRLRNPSPFSLSINGRWSPSSSSATLSLWLDWNVFKSKTKSCLTYIKHLAHECCFFWPKWHWAGTLITGSQKESARCRISVGTIYANEYRFCIADWKKRWFCHLCHFTSDISYF